MRWKLSLFITDTSVIIAYIKDKTTVGLAILYLDIQQTFDTISHIYIKVVGAYGSEPYDKWFVPDTICRDLHRTILDRQS